MLCLVLEHPHVAKRNNYTACHPQTINNRFKTKQAAVRWLKEKCFLAFRNLSRFYTIPFLFRVLLSKALDKPTVHKKASRGNTIKTILLTNVKY